MESDLRVLLESQEAGEKLTESDRRRLTRLAREFLEPNREPVPKIHCILVEGPNGQERCCS